MNAADYYGLEELRRACAGFVQCCINVDTVCALLASAERYIQYKCTKTLVQKVLEFVDEHGTEVLNLGSFTLHVKRNPIKFYPLARPSLLLSLIYAWHIQHFRIPFLHFLAHIIHSTIFWYPKAPRPSSL